MPHQGLRISAFVIWPAAYGVVVGALCLWPSKGPPHFRYTGSDPDREVWNFGVLANFIYDPEFGWQVGPFALILLALLIGTALCLASGLYVRSRRQPPNPLETDRGRGAP